MKTSFFAIIASLTLSLFFLNIYSQDVLVLNDQSILKVKVIEISEEVIKYKKSSNLDGPSYSKKVNLINYIEFENGEKEYFSKELNSEGSSSYSRVPRSGSDSKGNSNSGSSSENNNGSNQVLGIDESRANAYVNSIIGVDIYCLSKPVLAYKEVILAGNVKSQLSLKSIATGGVVRDDVGSKMDKIVNAALKENSSIDGIIYTSGKKAIAIKYVQTASSSEKKAVVNKLNGVEVYAFCEPIKKYDVISEAKAKSGGFTSVGSYGLINSSIADDLQKMVERLNKKKNIDAIIYSIGKKGVGVIFI